jgi:hypothetical protein
MKEKDFTELKSELKKLSSKELKNLLKEMKMILLMKQK